MLAAATLSLFTTPFFGYLSDRIGRKRMYLIGAFTMLAFAFPYFWMLDSRIPFLVVLAILLSLPIHDMQARPAGGLHRRELPAERALFGLLDRLSARLHHVRGPAPMIAAYLLHTYGTSTAISAYIAFIAAISFTSALFLRDRSRDDYATNEGWVRANGHPWRRPKRCLPPPDLLRRAGAGASPSAPGFSAGRIHRLFRSVQIENNRFQ